jgi:N-acetylmuramoyl-L-alanine amidase
MKFRFVVVALLTSFFSSFAQAHESDVGYGYRSRSEDGSAAKDYVPVIQTTTRLEKFSLVLSTLGIPEEAAPNYTNFPQANTLAEADLDTRLHVIDPEGGLKRYLSLSLSDLSVFQDFFSAVSASPILEYALPLAAQSTPKDSEALLSHLEQIAAQVKSGVAKPLSGLKVVLDPGHMGTDFWDRETGKFVEIDQKKVSEGDINLWTAMLVANSLEDLGATVILTRDKQGPVSQENYPNYNIAPFVNQYFYDSLDDWMAKYLRLSDATLQATIKEKPEVKEAYDSAKHSDFFISGADLEARSQIIDQQNPDIVFDIHYDANLTDKLETSNSLEAFVPGAFQSIEVGSRKMRSYSVNHLTSTRRFDASADLASEVVNAMSASEKVPLQSDSAFLGAETVKISNGVYARNLYITRRNLTALMVYLECLHYDNNQEFQNLLKITESGNYHGLNFQYPARLNDVASGIKTGLLNYFKK